MTDAGREFSPTGSLLLISRQKIGRRFSSANGPSRRRISRLGHMARRRCASSACSGAVAVAGQQVIVDRDVLGRHRHDLLGMLVVLEVEWVTRIRRWLRRTASNSATLSHGAMLSTCRSCSISSSCRRGSRPYGCPRPAGAGESSCLLLTRFRLAALSDAPPPGGVIAARFAAFSLSSMIFSADPVDDAVVTHIGLNQIDLSYTASRTEPTHPMGVER